MNRRWIPRVIRIVIWLIFLLPLLFAVYRQWDDVGSSLARIDLGLDLVGLAILLLAQPLMGLISWIILRYLKQRQPYLKITLLYFISQAAKYLPGGVWAFPGRVIAYQLIGVERGASVISLIREIGALFLGASAVGLLGLSLGLVVDQWIRTAIIVGILVCVCAVLLARQPWLWRLLSRFISLPESLWDGRGGQNQIYAFGGMPSAFLVSVIFWFLAGFGFRFLVLSITGNVVQMSWLQSAGIFSLAWCAGFVIIVAPAGLGVREAALTGLLLDFMPSGEALSVSLLARLWWMLAEAGYIIIAIYFLSGKITQWKSPHYR